VLVIGLIPTTRVDLWNCTTGNTEEALHKMLFRLFLRLFVYRHLKFQFCLRTVHVRKPHLLPHTFFCFPAHHYGRPRIENHGREWFRISTADTLGRNVVLILTFSAFITQCYRIYRLIYGDVILDLCSKFPFLFNIVIIYSQKTDIMLGHNRAYLI